MIHVLAEDGLPPFSYSVGIGRKAGIAEVVIIGLKRPIAHFLINEYHNRVREGERFEICGRYSGFIEGFECEIRKVDVSQYREYLGRCRWFYKGDGFDAVQIVYPNASGVWPWEPEASDWFNSWQILLERPL